MNAKRGEGASRISKKLTGNNFIKLSQKGLHVPYINREIISVERLRQFQVARQATTSKIADLTGYDRIRLSAHIDSKFLQNILREEIIPDFDAIRASEKEHRVYCTNAQTGHPKSFDLREAATLDEALDYVDASSHLPFICGDTVKIGNDKLFDGCYSASYPVHDIVQRGYNRIVMMLSLHPDDVLKNEGELGNLVDLYARLNARSSTEVYAEYRSKLPALIEEILSGEIKTDHGMAHIRVIHPEKIDPKMNPLETSPAKLEEGFWRGYARGKIFVSQVEREHHIAQMERERILNGEFITRLEGALGFNNAASLPVPRVA